MYALVQPPAELLDNLPDGVSLESALTAWYGGHNDGYMGKEYRIFKESLGIQDIYTDGYDRGKKNRSVQDEVNKGQESSEQEQVASQAASPLSQEVSGDDLNAFTALDNVLGFLVFYQEPVKTVCYGAVALLALKVLLSERLP